MQKLSVIIITYNEEHNITDCIESVKWADEIIVVDSNSNDNTIALAKKYTDKIFFVTNSSYSQSKNAGLDNAVNDWILSIDADERVTEELKNEICTAINNADNIKAYFLNRKSFFISKFIKHCGWYPDYILRLFRISAGIRFNDSKVHEKAEYSGKTGKLNANLLHYTDLSFEHYWNKMNRYTSISAEELFAKKRKASFFDIIFRPAFAFFKMYFLKLGILDGFTGLVLCTLSSVHVFVKYSKLYYLNNSGD
ncbi:MAG: glycosyltransferase family 2 protein [Ignavibacteriae bacterium]|nr:MAG: glycosyltransferase family 2 protein [Ignavibacteriota bacterium]